MARQTATTEAEAQPFGDGDSQMSGTELTQYFARGIEGVKVNAGGLATYEQVSEAPPLIDKSQLVNQPFVIHQVRIIKDGAVAPDTGEVSDLVMVCGQAVKLNENNVISKAGRVFIYTAGSNLGVHGGEFVELAGVASPENPVLARFGLTEKRAAKGSYWTLRPDAQKANVDLFPD